VNKPNFKNILAEVAPVLATAFGGPLAGVAAKAIAGKMLGREDASLDEVIAAVEGASPADLVKLKDLELEFATQMRDAEIDLERVAAGDRDSARNRQARMKDWTPSVLGTAIVLGFFGLLAYIVKYGLPSDGSDVLLIMVGALAAMTTQVGNYFFGSSTGSKNKDEIIADLKAGAQ